MALHGLFDPRGIVLEPFFLDRTEVTNSAYKEFLKSGGYTDPKYWKQEFKKGGQVIPWAEAIKLFVDQTGQLPAPPHGSWGITLRDRIISPFPE